MLLSTSYFLSGVAKRVNHGWELLAYHTTGASAVMTLLARCLMNRRSNAGASQRMGMGKGRKGESLVSWK